MIINFNDLSDLRSRLSDKKIALGSGTFDILHTNHIHYLNSLRKFGDVTVLMISGDARVTASKGSDRPIIPEADRIEVVNALRAIDYCFIEPGTSKRGSVDSIYETVFMQLQPDVYVTTNETWVQFKNIMGNTELVVLPLVSLGSFDSTSAIVERIKSKSPVKI